MRRWIVAAMVCSVAGAACQILAGIHDDTFTYNTPPIEPQEGGPGDSGTPDAATTCSLGRIRQRPSDLVDTRPADGRTYVFAVASLRIAGLDDPIGTTSPPGFNLDMKCTCNVESDAGDAAISPSCIPPSNAAPPNPCDLPNGVDNGLANVAQGLQGAGVFDHLSDQVQCGAQNILFAVSDYGGGPNDSNVSIVGVSSVGMEGYLDGGTSDRDATCGFPPPKLDGTDVWLAEAPFPGAPGSLANPTFPVPALGDPHGFVQDHHVYAEVTSGGYSFKLKIFGAEMEIASPTFSGTLVPLDEHGDEMDDTTTPAARYRVDDGLIGGRVRATDVLKALASTVCADPLGQQLFNLIHDPMCQARDLAADEGSDNQNAPCTDLSVAFRFTAFQANIGSLADAAAPLPPGPCDASCDP